MIPQSRIPTTLHHPLAPILPNAFLYPSFLLPLLTRKNPGNLSKPRNSSRLPGLILSSVYPLKPAKFLFLSCTARIFSKSSLLLPSLVRTSSFCLLTQNRYGVPFPSLRPHRRRTAAVPHGSSFFRSPHPPDRRRTVNGPFCVPGSRLLSVYSSPPPECRPFHPPFCAQNAPASPTAPCSLPKLPIPFSPLGNRFILLQNRSFFFFLRQNYEKLSGFN